MVVALICMLTFWTFKYRLVARLAMLRIPVSIREERPNHGAHLLFLDLRLLRCIRRRRLALSRELSPLILGDKTPC